MTLSRSARLAALAAVCLSSAAVHAQTAPHGHPPPKQAAAGPQDIKAAMAELQLARGKSPELKALARRIIATQKREIAQFDRRLARHR